MTTISDRTKFIISELASGKPQATLARELGLSRQRINQIINQEYRRQTELFRVRPRTNEYGVTFLRLIRQSRDITLAQVKEAINLSLSTISHIEAGMMARLSKAEELAAFYGVPLGELFEMPDPAAAQNNTGTEG